MRTIKNHVTIRQRPMIRPGTRPIMNSLVMERPTVAPSRIKLVLGGMMGPRMAPEAASGSMGFENSMQAACLPRAQTVNSTMPPVVEPMVIGRHSALPIMGFLYISALFWSPHLSPNIIPI